MRVNEVEGGQNGVPNFGGKEGIRCVSFNGMLE